MPSDGAHCDLCGGRLDVCFFCRPCRLMFCSLNCIRRHRADAPRNCAPPPPGAAPGPARPRAANGNSP
jgi:hypothetical protein